MEYENRYIMETNEEEKKYLELVYRPQKFDINRDRKISKKEIEKAILYAISSGDPSKTRKVPEFFMNHVRSNIRLFVLNLKKDFLNYKQFQYIIRSISITHFFNTNMMDGKGRAIKEGRNESEF